MIAIIKPNSNLAFQLNLSTKIEYHPALIPSLNTFISGKKKKKDCTEGPSPIAPKKNSMSSTYLHSASEVGAP